MQKRHLSFITALLALSGGAAQAADWTSAIGTGHAADSRAAQAAVSTQAVGVPAEPHWSALIGTGHVAYREPARSPVRNPQPVHATPHWTSQIGTGHAMDARQSVGPAS